MKRFVSIVEWGAWFGLALLAGLAIWLNGYKAGQQDGVSTVMCVMDRIARAEPAGARTDSKYCRHIGFGREN